MPSLKQFVLNNKVLCHFVIHIVALCHKIKLYIDTNKRLSSSVKSDKRVFYIGIPAHSNLGDLAQGVCIRRWLKKHYSDYNVVEIETNSLVHTPFSLIGKLKKIFNEETDFIVFQSGYTTTDLGGYADEMHRVVMHALPDARMLMMPQTIFFKNEENKAKTAASYNVIKHLLFLARDRVSYQSALEMFPNITVKQYPDIVTTLIGKKTFNNERKGILFCCRDDSEKYYTDEQIQSLMDKCTLFAEVAKTDTTKRNASTKEIVNRAETYIKGEIETYSKYQLIITDRYHGTILSLVAGTPVIIIKTTDHKVTTGAEWLKGVYDDYVYVAPDLSEAYELAKKVFVMPLDHRLEPYFEREYYDKLPELFEKNI